MKTFIKLLSSGCVLKRSLVVTVAVLGALALQAQNRDTDQTQDKGQKQAQEKTGALTSSAFVKEAVQGNLAEIALAEIAAYKSQNPEVKQFAEHIRKDHTEANQKLRPIAQQSGVAINQSLDEKHEKKLSALKSLSGEQFDKEYTKEMLKDHAKDVAKYERASQQLQEAELKQYAQETLPKLRGHLQHAKDVAKAVGIDEATISSLVKGTPEGVGGVGDSESSERGAGKKDKDKEEHEKP
jgi:putative membrane protein